MKTMMMKSWIGSVALLVVATSCYELRPAEQGSDTVQKPAVRGGDIVPLEAWDGRNAPRVFGTVESMRYEDLTRSAHLQGIMPERPWSDDYWPWMRAGLANRWILPERRIDIAADAPDYEAETRREIRSFLDFARQADEATRRLLSPIEKYDLLLSDDFEMTRKELALYARYQRYYTAQNIAWEWMGSCDGWAIAANHTPAPRHAVLASAAGREPVLFTVGDVRGLVSKVYTDNHKSHSGFFLGTRCDRPPQDLVRDRNNRVVDGVLGRWDGDRMADQRIIRIVRNNWEIEGHRELELEGNVIVFRYEAEPDELYWLQGVAVTDEQEEIFRVEVRPAVEGRLDPGAPAETRDFRYLKSCRDLNPGALPIVLAQFASEAAVDDDRSTTFTIEISRTHEVWNHPVYAYTTRLGEPLDLETLDPRGPQDPYAPYRAPEARYLVHGFTTVYFGTENGPLLTYGPRDELLASRTYQYTLELDEEQYVIGGEWHQAPRLTADRLRPLSGTALLRRLATEVAQRDGVDAPDFLWRFPENTQALDTCPSPPCLSATAISRLAECSRETPREGDTVVVRGRSLPFVRCSL